MYIFEYLQEGRYTQTRNVVVHDKPKYGGQYWDRFDIVSVIE